MISPLEQMFWSVVYHGIRSWALESLAAWHKKGKLQLPDYYFIISNVLFIDSHLV